MAQEFEDLHLLALVASTMERYSTEKPATICTSECTANGFTTCANNESFKRASGKDKSEEHNSGSSSPVPCDQIVYKPGHFQKTRECHRCYVEADLAELEQRLDNLKEAFSFWEYLRGYLRTNDMNPQLERSICDFMEVVKKI